MPANNPNKFRNEKPYHKPSSSSGVQEFKKKFETDNRKWKQPQKEPVNKNSEKVKDLKVKEVSGSTAVDAIVAPQAGPSVLDIRSEYFQQEFNPKNLPFSQITDLKLNGRGFEDIKNLNLCENLKRLEVAKNKLKNLKVTTNKKFLWIHTSSQLLWWLI